MCGGVDVRYVHHMQHRDYPNVLAVGFVCAEHTEEDYAGPRRREEHLKSAARRRASWARLGWKLSRKRNFYLNAEGFNFTIFRNGPRYKVAVKNRETDQSRLGDQSTTRLTPRKWARSTNCSWRRRTSAEEKASRRA